MNGVYHEHDFARTQRWSRVDGHGVSYGTRSGFPSNGVYPCLEEPDEGLRPMEGRTRARFVCVWEKRTNVVLSPLLHDIAGCIHRFIVYCAEIFLSYVSISSSLSPDP